MSVQFSFLQDQRYSAAPDFAHLEEIGFSSFIVERQGSQVAHLDAAAEIARHTAHLGIFVTHRAGLTDPCVAANQLAFLDQLVCGRLGLRVVAGVDDQSEAHLGHEASWRRTDEYLTLLKRLWSNSKPIDHEGEFYSVRQGFVAEKGPQGRSMQFHMTGRTGTAIKVCARHATVFGIDYGPRDSVALTVQKVRETAVQYGRAKAIRFALSIPDDVVVETLGAVRAANALEGFLQPFVEIGVSQFTFGRLAAARLGATLAAVSRQSLGSFADAAREMPDWPTVSLRTLN